MSFYGVVQKMKKKSLFMIDFFFVLPIGKLYKTEATSASSKRIFSRLNRKFFSCRNTDDDTDANEVWSHHLDELGDRLNQDGERASFLRMVNRNHLFNCSNYSLSSLFR